MWKQYKDTDYYLSPDGRIMRRYKKGDILLSGYMHRRRDKKGSDYYVFKAYGSEVTLARAMWETFIGKIPSDHRIIHKNGIKTMNGIDNLACVPLERLGSLTGGKTRITQTVVDLDSGKTYIGTRAAGKMLHISRQTVSDYCNNKVKKPMYNLMWGEKRYEID